MSGIEIALLLIGALILVVSFVFSDVLDKGEKNVIDNEMIIKVTEEMVSKEVENELANVLDDKIEQTEAKLDKLSNEKIMALGAYSDTVIEDINKNHNEVMFLYNMLNNKEETLKNTIRDIEALKKSVMMMASAEEYSRIETESEEAATKESVTVNAIAKVESTDEKVSVNKKIKSDIIAPTNNEKEIQSEQPKAKNNNKLILDLYAKGKTNIEIAKELGLGIGEVRLVIDLYNSAK